MRGPRYGKLSLIQTLSFAEARRKESCMSDQRLGTGFRFSRVMAWAPALVLVVGFLFVLRGDMAVGFLVAAAAIVFWIIVRRRRTITS